MIAGKKRKFAFFSKENLIEHLLILLIVVVGSIIAFISDVFLLKVLAYIAISVIGVIVLTYFVVSIVIDKYPGLVYVINEILYLVIGIPLLIIAGLFVPISIYVFFFKPDNIILVSSIIALAAILEILSVMFVIKQKLKEKNMTFSQYIRDLFSIKRRIEEQKRIKARREQIDQFYGNLDKVKRIQKARLDDRSSGKLEEFDWKKRLEELSTETIEGIPCFNCGHLNEKNATVCANCGAEIAKQKPHSPISRRKIFTIKYYSTPDPEYKEFKQYISIIIFGALLLLAGGILNIADQTVKRWSLQNPFLPYIFAGIISLSFIPIGMGIKWLAEDYFEPLIVKKSREINFFLMAYSISFFVSAIVLGNIIVVSFTSVIMIIARVVAFSKIDSMLRRISRFWKTSLGSAIYVIFGYYQVIISFFAWLATIAYDATFEVLLFTFNGIIESMLIIGVAIRLIIDFLKINNYVISKNIKPKAIDKSLIIKELIEKRKNAEI